MATQVAKREAKGVQPWFRRGPLSNLRQEMEEWFTHAFNGEEAWPFGQMLPTLDMSETDQLVEVRMDLPGVDAKHIDIQISGNMLNVSGERKEEKEEKGKTWHRVERRCGSFSRSVVLPCPVNEDNVDAQYRDGILTIKLPKTEEAKARKIEVKT
jgi:HSP20 family protein